MNFSLTQGFQKKAQKLCKKDPQLRQALAKQFSLFQENHLHPSLRVHKLKGKRSEQYAIWIIGDLRALGVKSEDEYVFFDLVNHDQY
jgi:mRNA-degrading endonuclease YafQ of YafQ-DinJ toxin-antitoxin module